MARTRPSEVSEIWDALTQLSESQGALLDNAQFMLKMQEKTSLIQIRIAYVLETIYESLIEKFNDKDFKNENINNYLKEIKTLFDDQREIMRESRNDKE